MLFDISSLSSDSEIYSTVGPGVPAAFCIGMIPIIESAAAGLTSLRGQRAVEYRRHARGMRPCVGREQ